MIIKDHCAVDLELLVVFRKCEFIRLYQRTDERLSLSSTKADDGQVRLTHSSTVIEMLFPLSIVLICASFIQPARSQCTQDGLWESTAVGEVALLSCSTFHNVNYFEGSVSRTCESSGWSDPVDDCTYLAPWGLSYPTGIIYRTGSQISLIPTYFGFVSLWSISPSLPSFLNWDNQTGSITGMLENAFEQMFTITAANPDASSTVSLTISVLNSGCDADGDWPATPALQTVYLPCKDEYHYVGNISRTCEGYALPQWSSPVSACQLGPPYSLRYPYSTVNVFSGIPVEGIRPTHRGKGDSYTVTPSLPKGLSLNYRTGEISGVVDSDEFCMNVEITLNNNAGSCSTSLEICVIAVVESTPIPIQQFPKGSLWMYLTISVLLLTFTFFILFAWCGCCRPCKRQTRKSHS